MIVALVCNCGGSTMSAQGFLESAGCPNWLNVDIYKGKEKGRSFLSTLMGFPEAQMLDNYLQSASKYVVIFGWNEKGCRWADISHNPTKSKIEAQVIVDVFA